MPIPSWTPRNLGSMTVRSRNILLKLSREAARPIDYSQINPRNLGSIYERFLGHVIEIKERRLDPQAGRERAARKGHSIRRSQ